MTSIWNHLQDTALAGKYRLQELLEESEGGVFFRTTFGLDQQTAALQLIAETSPAAGEEQLKLWRITARVSHPNLIRLLDYGRTEQEGEPFLFAVFEAPDDTLAGALDHGAVSADETREVAVAAVDGLSCIHSQGLVHGAIDASHVVAIGDQIKLSSDTLRLLSGEDAAGDIRALGALVYRLISGRRVEPGTDPDLSSIPEPFRTVVGHSLADDPNERWSLAQLSAALKLATKPGRPEAGRQTAAARSRPFPKWILWATPAFLIVLILVFRGIKPGSETAPPPAAAVQAAVAPKTAPARNWRVIAYTYARRAQAEKRAQSINRKWSGAQAEVIEPGAAKPGNYLVAVGGPMDRDEALRFLKVARSRGMPRGTYVRSN